MNFLRSIIKNIYIFIIFQILKIIKNFVVIRFGLTETRAIGHFSKPIEIYLAEKEILHNDNKKFIDIWFTNEKVSNIFLLKKWKILLLVFPNFLIKPLYYYCRKNNLNHHLIPYREWEDNPVWQVHDINKVLIKTKPKITFTKKEILFCESELKKIGLNKGDNFFCFFARDNAYRFTSDKYDNIIKNFDINQFEYACNYMQKFKYKSVRIGNKVQDNINFKNSNLINYSQSKIVSPMLDLYLAYKCEFFCGGDTGLFLLASLFRKESLIVNTPLHSANDLDDGLCQMIIFKKIFSKKENRILSFSETLALTKENHDNLTDELIMNNNLKVLDNSKEEIKDLIEEFMQRKNNSWKKNSDESEISEIINNFFIKNNFKKLNYIKVGYKFAKKNIDLFK
tara:strand:- start:128 stop:1315 length:1188 start_codon:yes stop_codon:yes gene_type:complete